MLAKERHSRKLIEFIGNPENDVPSRGDIPPILGIASKTMYHHFSPAELSEVEAKGLALRRTKYAPGIARADKALFDKAAEGDVRAIELVYKRHENWSEKRRIGVGWTKEEIHKMLDAVDDDDCARQACKIIANEI